MSEKKEFHFDFYLKAVFSKPKLSRFPSISPEMDGVQCVCCTGAVKCEENVMNIIENIILRKRKRAFLILDKDLLSLKVNLYKPCCPSEFDRGFKL